MRLLFITDNFPPEVNAPATRTYEHCKEWVDQGVDVTVITCFPNFPKGKIYEGYKHKLYQKESIDGIKVIRLWSYITVNAGFIKRILDFLSFAIMAFWTGLFVKTDLIVATSPQFFTTWSAFGLSKIKRKPWVFELRDIWPESIKAVGAISGDSRIFKFLECVERALYSDADLIISVTESFKKNLILRGISEAKIQVVRNGANLKRFKPQAKNKALESKYKIGGKVVLGYVGTHGMAHKLDFILEAFKSVRTNVHLLFIGDGAEKKKLIAYAEKLELKNVTFIDSVTKGEVVDYLSLIDISLVPLKKSDLFKTVIPSKIFENAAMRIPLLLGVEGESKSIIEKFDAGECFEPESQEDFHEKLNNLLDSKERYENCQLGCDSLAKQFDRVRLANEMKSHLDFVVSK